MKAVAVDCYDAKGNLVPDEFAQFGGVTISCAPGQTARVHQPPASPPAQDQKECGTGEVNPARLGYHPSKAHRMKIKLWQWEYDFDKDDAKIVVPLILLLLGLTLTPLEKRRASRWSSRLLSLCTFSSNRAF